MRDPALWRISISTFVIMTVTIGLVVHQIPILTDAGFSRETAALYALPAGLAGIVGKLVTGWLLDRFPARWVGGLSIGATAVRSEEHTSEIQSLMRISYAVLCWKKKNTDIQI